MDEKTRKKNIRIFITPQTHIRVTQGDSWLFGVSDQYLSSKYPSALKRKKYLRRYSSYKESLRLLAHQAKFNMPASGAWIKFYIPMPKTWSKKKRTKLSFEPHQTKPDIDNFTKAFFDCLLRDDNIIWDVRVS